MAARIPTLRFPENPIPAARLAFGTGTAHYNSDCSKQVKQALDAGFRHIDCAEMYANEDSAGKAIADFLKSSNAKREDLFVTTKVGNGQKDLQKAIKEALNKLQLDYVDAYLLHFPPRGEEGLPSNADAWREMEKIKEAGLARSIGVSNWLAPDLEEVLKIAKHKPTINQIEFHPYVYADKRYKDLLAVQAREGITTMVYSPQGPMVKESLSPPLSTALESVAFAHSGQTSASVLLRWAYQRSAGVVVTTSGKPQRLAEYLNTFAEDKAGKDELSEAELQKIDKAGAEHGTAKYWMGPYFEI